MALTKPRAYQIYDIDYKQAVRVVSTANVTLGGGAPNSVDGVNLSQNDRVLVTGQSSKAQNGIYYVTTVGSGSNGTWARSVDANTTGEVLAGMIVMVTEGGQYADTQWKLLTNDPIAIGSTELTFAQNFGVGGGTTLTFGTTNLGIPESNGNANVTISGTSNVVVWSTAGEYVTGLISATGNITASGNVSGNYLLGNGTYITGLSASKIFNGTSEANIGTTNGNANISINGTSNVVVVSSGGVSVTGNVTTSGQLVSTVTTGTAPLAVSSTTVVTNLNAQLLQGYSVADANSPSTAVTRDGNGSFAANVITATLSGAATTAGTVTTAAQPNITSVGTLSSLTVTGNVTGGNLTTAGITSTASLTASTTVTATGNVTGGNLTTAGILTVNSGNAVSAIVNGGGNGVGNIGSSTKYFNTVFAKATSAQYADLAEMYQGDQTYMPGTVVEFGGTHEVTITIVESSTKIAGVVSTNPSYIMNSGLNSLNSVPVALTGRVPCQVLGPVRKGDRLVSSMIPGVAQALDESTYRPGCMIGKSLEDWTETSVKLIEVVVGRL